MSEMVLFKEGLRIGRRELTLLQNAGLDNLAALAQALTNAPAVLTTRQANGALGPELLVTVSGTNVQIASGSALLVNGTVLTLAAAQTLAVADGAAGLSVVLKAGTTPFVAGALNLAVDRLTLTAVAGTPDLTEYYEANGYVDLSNAGTDLGAFRIQSVTSTGLVLAEAVPGSGTVNGLQHGPAGKFFPNYPLPGDTVDLASFDSPALRIDVANYVPQASEIVLASVSRAGAAVTVVDLRVALLGKNSLTSIADAEVATNANIATSKLDAAARAAIAEAHAQNTDSYTSAPAFFIGGATGKRVLTTDDLPHGTGVTTSNATWPAIAAELNATFEFFDPNTGSVPKVAGPRVVLNKLTWGIDAVAGAAAVSGGVQTIAIGSPDMTPVSTNQLVGYVLYDAVGRPWSITGNTASAPDHSFSVTVGTTDIQGSSTGTAAAGNVTILSSASNYRFEVVEKVGGVPDESTKYVETGTLNALGYPNNARQLSFIATPGTAYVIRIIGVRNGVEATYSLNASWGVQPVTPSVSVASASISADSTLSTVSFSWPSPAGYDSGTMDYSVAVQIDGAPAVPVFNLRATETPKTGGAADGAITVPCGPGQMVTVFVNVIDLSGAVISTAAGTRSYPAQTNIFTTFQKETFTLNATGANYPTAPASNVIGLNLFPRTILGGVYEIGGIEIDLTTFNVAANTRFKVGVAPADSPSSVVWSDEFGDGAATNPIAPGGSSYAPILTQTQGTRFQSGMLLTLECTNPASNYVAALTSIVGTVSVFYRMVGTLSKYNPNGLQITQ